jgi:GTP1/OBG
VVAAVLRLLSLLQKGSEAKLMEVSVVCLHIIQYAYLRSIVLQFIVLVSVAAREEQIPQVYSKSIDIQESSFTICTLRCSITSPYCNNILHHYTSKTIATTATTTFTTAAGSGGRGGNVVLECAGGLNTLGELRGLTSFVAGRGADGSVRYNNGKDGEDVTVKVPAGTVVANRVSDVFPCLQLLEDLVTTACNTRSLQQLRLAEFSSELVRQLRYSTLKAQIVTVCRSY